MATVHLTSKLHHKETPAKVLPVSHSFYRHADHLCADRDPDLWQSQDARRDVFAPLHNPQSLRIGRITPRF